MSQINSTQKTINILMVEDDELDIEIFRRCMMKQRLINPLVVAGNGEEALEILRHTHPSKSLSKPYIILMDINMPRMNGLECIQAIRNDPELKEATVFVMTTSDDDKDIYNAYQLNIAGYMVKSTLGDNFINSVLLIDKYCTAIVAPE